MINYPLTSNDLQDLPYPSNCEVYVFVGAVDDDLNSVNWKFWNKPKGTTMTYILAIGGGGGGGRGFQRAAGGDGGGGGGGASAGIARLLIPSFFLPDVLYIRPGSGGEGSATAGVAGTNGGIAYVCYSQDTNAPNVLLQSSAAQTGGGGTGTGVAIGALGTAAAISTISTGAIIGLFSAIAGQNGGAGGAQTGGNGGAITAWGSVPLSGGGGGGGSTGATATGGAITATAATNFTFVNWPNTAGAVATAGANTGGKGNAGVNLWKPFRTSGASGGGTNDTTGGDGNSAGIGSGGGGGGAGVTAGSGGNGGPGMVMIMSW
jgi:hypothetical protein